MSGRPTRWDDYLDHLTRGMDILGVALGVVFGWPLALLGWLSRRGRP